MEENVTILREPESKADRFRRLFNVQYPDPKIGEFWPNKDLCELFVCDHETMINQMRDTIGPMLYRRGLQLECVRGKGQRVNDPNQNIILSEKRDKAAEKKAEEAFKPIAITKRDDLDEYGKQRYDHAQQKAAMILGAYRTHRSLPSIKSPKALESGQDVNAVESKG